MAGRFLDSPRTEADETRVSQTELPDFSAVKSFISPSKGQNDLLQQLRNGNGRNGSHGISLSTPSASRNPLATRRNAQPSRNEFTPMLHSATHNRMKMRYDSKENGVNQASHLLETPAAMKPGFRLSGTPLPEASSLFDATTESSIMDGDQSLGPPVASSSAMSTPMALPRRGEGGLEGGNALTLREQEAKLEQIDKENFGLKLKIHFLEQNLQRSGNEAHQVTLKENTDLKVDNVTLQSELKKHSKSLKRAEQELEQYRRQLQEYADKVKRRHQDESLKEEMEELRRTANKRATEIEALHAQLSKSGDDDEELENLRGDIDDLEAELRAKQELIDEKDDQLDELKSKLGNDSDKERVMQEQTDQIDRLEKELGELAKEKEEEIAQLHDQIDSGHEDILDEVDSLRRKLAHLEVEKKEQMVTYEEQLRSLERENDLEIKALERQSQVSKQERQSEIDSLTDRLRLAESQGDNQLQLAQQAAQDIREQLRQVTHQKNSEIEELKSKLDLNEAVQVELEECRRQLREYMEESQQRQLNSDEREEQLGTLRKEFSQRERGVESLNRKVQEQKKELERLHIEGHEHSSTKQESNALQVKLAERELDLTNIQRKLATYESNLNERDRELETTKRTLQERTYELDMLRDHADEPDTQLEILQTIAKERDSDLETLRETVNSQKKQIEAIQRTAEERLVVMEQLKAELTNTKQDLEDEVQVLVEDAEEARQEKHELQAKIAGLELDASSLDDLQQKIQLLEKKLRSNERENADLKTKLEMVEHDLNMVDQDRESLNTRVQKLTKELQNSRVTAQADRVNAEEHEDLHERLKIAQIEIEELQRRVHEKQNRHADTEERLRTDIRDKEKKIKAVELELETLMMKLSEKDGEIEAYKSKWKQQINTGMKSSAADMKDLHERLRNATLDVEDLQTQLRDRDDQLEVTSKELRSLRREKERRSKLAHAETTQQMQIISAAETEVTILKQELREGEKKHAGELKGLAKQIQFLRARLGREEGFRESLAYEKKFFLMQIEMYDACNKEDLKLIEEMGITPDKSFRQRKPSLRAVVFMAIAGIRMRRMQTEWAKNKKIHESLVKKLEQMRKQSRRSAR